MAELSISFLLLSFYSLNYTLQSSDLDTFWSFDTSDAIPLLMIWASACCVKDVYWSHFTFVKHVWMLVVNLCMFVEDFLFVKHLDTLVGILKVWLDCKDRWFYIFDLLNTIYIDFAKCSINDLCNLIKLLIFQPTCLNV